MYNHLHHYNGFRYYPVNGKESLKGYDQKFSNSTKSENHFNDMVEIRFVKNVGIIWDREK